MKAGQKVWTTVTVCGRVQRMAQGVIVGIKNGIADVDVMSIHGGAAWIQKHALTDLEPVTNGQD